VLAFLKEGKVTEGEGIDGLCLHPVDIFHKSLCGIQPTTPRGLGNNEADSSSMAAAVEIKAAGIHFRKSEALSFNGISFKNGVLRLPALQVFLNLMAFERLHRIRGDGLHDNIIDSEKDVALLRSKGIIKNLLSSDKGAALSPNSRLHDVRQRVNAHCKDSGKRWIAYFRRDHLRNPWVIISLIAAVILLLAALLQTLYTVWSFYVPRRYI
jgi:hypothetical protein